MNIEAICLAVAGSACVQLLKLIDLSKIPEDERPNFKDVTYYFQYIIFPIISGVMGYAYFDESEHINRMLAIQIGASSPLLFKSLTNVIPTDIIKRF